MEEYWVDRSAFLLLGPTCRTFTRPILSVDNCVRAGGVAGFDFTAAVGAAASSRMTTVPLKICFRAHCHLTDGLIREFGICDQRGNTV